MMRHSNVSSLEWGSSLSVSSTDMMCKWSHCILSSRSVSEHTAFPHAVQTASGHTCQPSSFLPAYLDETTLGPHNSQHAVIWDAINYHISFWDQWHVRVRFVRACNILYIGFRPDLFSMTRSTETHHLERWRKTGTSKATLGKPSPDTSVSLYDRYLKTVWLEIKHSGLTSWTLYYASTSLDRSLPQVWSSSFSL